MSTPVSVPAALARYHSRSQDADNHTPFRPRPARPTSPPPRPLSPPYARPKSSIFAPLRRDTLPSLSDAAGAQPYAPVPMPMPAPFETPRRGKSKEGKRWTKRASRKAPPPPGPTTPYERQSSEEFEQDWERIRTLPRVRLVPPEGSPVMLYPVPHPSTLLPLPASPSSPPTLLSATIAASSETSDPASPPPKQAARASQPPPGIALGSLAHATSSAAVQQQHGHWIGMSDKFILPPPVFARTGASRRIVMPKTRRQLEADIGRRMSMVEQRKRDSLEIQRNILLPPLEEAAQSPPNVMLPPLVLAGGMDRLEEEDDEPLARVMERRTRGLASPESVKTRHVFSSGPGPMNERAPGLPPRKESLNRLPESDSVPIADLIASESASSLPTRTGRDSSALEIGPGEMILDLRRYSAASSSPDSAPARSPLRRQSAAPVASSDPDASSPVSLICDPSDSPPSIPSTRKQRAKSLSSGLVRPDDKAGPPVTPPIQLPAARKMKKQRSLKKLFFPSSSDESDANVPPVPVLPAATSGVHAAEPATSPISTMNRPDVGAPHTSRRTRPGLRISVHGPTPSDGPLMTSSSGAASADLLPRTPITPGLATGSTASEAYPSTPENDKDERVRPRNRRAAESATEVRPQSAGGKAITKRFSLSNMSAAFRRKGGAPSTATPTDVVGLGQSVPDVPAVPQAYRRAKGKSRADPEGNDRHARSVVDDVMAGMRRGQSLDIVRESTSITAAPERKTSMGPLFSAYSYDGVDVRDEQHADLGRSATIRLLPSPSIVSATAPTLPFIGSQRFGSARGIKEAPSPSGAALSDGGSGEDVGAFDVDFTAALSRAYEGETGTGGDPPSPALASSEGGCGSTPLTEPVLASLASRQHERECDDDDDDDDADAASLGSFDEHENPSIVHAKLMHVSPTTRRNPSVSLQDFLGSAPSSQAVLVLAQDADVERRKSMRGIVSVSVSDAPLTKPSSASPSAPPSRPASAALYADAEAGADASADVEADMEGWLTRPTSIVELVQRSSPSQGYMSKAELVRLDSGPEAVSLALSRVVSAGAAEMGTPMVIDLRGQYARRVIGNVGAAAVMSGATHGLVRANTMPMTAPAATDIEGLPAPTDRDARAFLADEGLEGSAQTTTEYMTRSDSASSASTQAIPTTPSALVLLRLMDADPDMDFDLDATAPGDAIGDVERSVFEGMGTHAHADAEESTWVPTSSASARFGIDIHAPDPLSICLDGDSSIGIALNVRLGSESELGHGALSYEHEHEHHHERGQEPATCALAGAHTDGCISTESGLVLVDSPILPPGWMSMTTPPTRSRGPFGSRGSRESGWAKGRGRTPGSGSSAGTAGTAGAKSRFPSPEVLLRLLHSPRSRSSGSGSASPAIPGSSGAQGSPVVDAALSIAGRSAFGASGGGSSIFARRSSAVFPVSATSSAGASAPAHAQVSVAADPERAATDPRYNKPLPRVGISGLPRDSLDGYARRKGGSGGADAAAEQGVGGEEEEGERWMYVVGRGLELSSACFDGLGLDLGEERASVVS